MIRHQKIDTLELNHPHIGGKMDSSCKTCSSSEFTIENSEKICMTCGEVQDDYMDEGRLCILPDNEAVVDSYRNKKYEASQRLTNRIRGETNDAGARRQICREKLLADMRRLVKQLIKHPAAMEETMSLIESTFRAHQGRLLSSRKLGLVGACIYYLSAKHQLGISLAAICKAVDIKMKVINVCLKLVRQLCPEFEFERPNRKDMVNKFIDDLSTKVYDPASLESHNPIEGHPSAEQKAIQPLLDSKDRIVLENRVMLLIDLFEAMYPYNQPTPQSLISAVTYHAWRSLDTFKLLALNLSSEIQNISGQSSRRNPSDDSDEQQKRKNAIKVKHSISFEKFCQLCNIKYSSNGHRIVSKLQSSLLMLGRPLGDVNKINLPWYLKDIIENSPDLIKEHMRSETSNKPPDKGKDYVDNKTST